MAEGTLGNQSLEISTLRHKNLDKFAITQAHHYQRGDVIKFKTDSARFSKNSYYRVTSVDPQTQTARLIDTVGLTETLSLDRYKQREVYQLQQLEIRPGERMRFTKNIRDSDHKQLNGQRFTVRGITDDGQIEITALFKRGVFWVTNAAQIKPNLDLTYRTKVLRHKPDSISANRH